MSRLIRRIAFVLPIVLALLAVAVRPAGDEREMESSVCRVVRVG